MPARRRVLPMAAGRSQADRTARPRTAGRGRPGAADPTAADPTAAGRERSSSTDCPTGAGYHRGPIASTGRRDLACRAALQVGITVRAATTRTREAKSRIQAAEADRARRRPAGTLLAGPGRTVLDRACRRPAGTLLAGPGRTVLDRADMAPAIPDRADMVRAVPDRADMARVRPGPATRGQGLGRRIWVRRTAGLERPGHPAGRGHRAARGHRDHRAARGLQGTKGEPGRRSRPGR